MVNVASEGSEVLNYKSCTQSGNSPFWCGVPFNNQLQKYIALARGGGEKRAEKHKNTPPKAQKHHKKNRGGIPGLTWLSANEKKKQ